MRGFKVLVLVSDMEQEHLTIEWSMRGFLERAYNLLKEPWRKLGFSVSTSFT
jgi:hypothetical protein